MPSNFSPSSWMSVFALIKRKSISFFFLERDIVLVSTFPA